MYVPYKHMIHSARSLVTLVMLSVVLATGSSSCGSSMTSVWRPGDITVDGVLDDWSVLPEEIDGDRVRLGVANDRESLYIAVVVADVATQAQILRRGFTIWFNIEGGGDQRYGIQYPIAPDPMELARQTVKFRRAQATNPDIASMYEKFQKHSAQLKVLNDKFSTTVDVKDEEPIAAAIDYAAGLLTYELRIPLERYENMIFTLREAQDNEFSMGLTTPEIDPEKMRDALGRNNKANAPVRRGGFRAGGMRGGYRPGTREQLPSIPDAIDIWVDVKLSADAGADVSVRPSASCH